MCLDGSCGARGGFEEDLVAAALVSLLTMPDELVVVTRTLIVPINSDAGLYDDGSMHDVPPPPRFDARRTLKIARMIAAGQLDGLHFDDAAGMPDRPSDQHSLAPVARFYVGLGGIYPISLGEEDPFVE